MGENSTETIDWSSLSAQIKNQVIVILNPRVKIVALIVQPSASIDKPFLHSRK